MNDVFTTQEGLQSLFQVPSFITLVVNTFFGFFAFNLGFILMLGAYKFIRHADDEKERESGRKMMIWCIIGIFLILSLWGIVRVLINTVKLKTAAPPVPQVTVQGNQGGIWGGGSNCNPVTDPNCVN